METTLALIAVAAVSIVALILAAIAAIKSFYVVPRADEALVKTGGRQPVVSTGGGLWVIPMFNRVTRVSLKAVKIPIERERENALPTANKIPAEIRGELIVRVSPDDPKHVVLAAQALGTDGQGDNRMELIIQQQVDSLVTDALRTAAFKKTFQELNSGKKEFADEVTQLLAEDLAKLGLTLTAVTIPHLKQGEFTKDAGDVFAAEGQRNVAETVAKNRQETNLINRQAEIKVKEQDVEARRRALELDRQQKELEAEQARQVAEFTATKETETKKAVLTQEQARALAEAEQGKEVETSRLKQLREIETTRIEQAQAVAVQRARAEAEQKKAQEEALRLQKEAEIARAKAVEAAEIEKQKAIKVADEQRAQAIAEAQVAREVAVAQKKAEEAKARADQATAEAERQRAEQAIVTVEAEATADRERRVVVIKAEEEATKQKVAADRDAYVQTKKAEADRDAAMKRAEAARAEAEGQASAAKAAAVGRADALKIEAEAEAAARNTRATAEYEASDKEAKAKIALAAALLEEGKARAEAERLAVEAKNAVSTQMLVRDVAIEAIRHAPDVVRELMAPVAKVSDVKVLQINGLGGGSEQANLPATILGTGMAISGALPVLKEALSGLASNPDVKEIGGAISTAAAATLREATSVVRDAAKEVPAPNVPEGR
jgi:flotillin